jgi:acyl-CoA synthetase (NDP forming)
MKEELKKLDFAFNPGSIAFVGATETVNKWGFLILNNLLTGGYSGKVYPVNPNRGEVLGLKAYPSVKDVPGPVDLAVFTVPAAKVIEAMRDCVEKGVKAALVISAGFKELGESGVALESELVKQARRGGMVLIGPNCQGICCPRNRLYPWMPILFHPPHGNVGLVSQSGNILNMLTGHVMEAGLGASKGISSGNEAMLGTVDYWEYLADDPDTHVIVSYIEGISDGRRFVEKARAVTRRKPVIVLKGGRTRSGVTAARSHTGAMAVSRDLFDAACRQAGIITARTIEEAGVTAASFVGRPLPRGRRVGIVTGGGGLGVIASDLCTELGLEIVRLSPRTLDKLAELLPAWWSPGNPVDLVAGLDLTVIKPVMEILMKSGEVDSVMFIWIGSPRRDGERARESKAAERGLDISRVWEAMDLHFHAFIKELYELMHELEVPLYVASSIKKSDGGEPGGSENPPLIYSSVESACLAVRAMASYREYLERG